MYNDYSEYEVTFFDAQIDEDTLLEIVASSFSEDAHWEYHEQADVKLFLKEDKDICLRFESIKEEKDLTLWFDGTDSDFGKYRRQVALACTKIANTLFVAGFVDQPSWILTEHMSLLDKKPESITVSESIRKKMHLPPYWEKILFEAVHSDSDFFAILDELQLEMFNKLNETGKTKGFYCNRTHLLKAYRQGRFFVLTLQENDEIYHNRDSENELFCYGSFGNCTLYLFPAFLVLSEDRKTIDFLWVHERARKKGLARCLVEASGVKTARDVLSFSVPFWEKIGIEILNIREAEL